MNFELYKNNLPYPSQRDLATTFFYQRGEVVGKAMSIAEVASLRAKFPNAVTEKVEDKETFKAMRDAYNAEERRVNDLFRKDCLAYCDLPDNAFTQRLFNLAWEHGHSNGLSEVANCLSELADLNLVAMEVYGK